MGEPKLACPYCDQPVTELPQGWDYQTYEHNGASLIISGLALAARADPRHYLQQELIKFMKASHAHDHEYRQLKLC